MHTRAPLFALLTLAFATAAFLAMSPELFAAAPPQTNNFSSTTLLIRRFSIRNVGSFAKIDTQELWNKLREQGLAPAVEKPYEQETVDKMMAVIREMYRSRGVEVSVMEDIEPTRSPRYIVLRLNIYGDAIAVSQPCRVTEPDQEARTGLKPWYINPEHTIGAFFWTSQPLKSSFGYKVLWIRPKPFPDVSLNEATYLLGSGREGRQFFVTGRRVDASAPPLDFSIGVGVYAQGIQPSSITFPTPGCWEVNAVSGDAALRFVVAVQ